MFFLNILNLKYNKVIMTTVCKVSYDNPKVNVEYIFRQWT